MYTYIYIYIYTHPVNTADRASRATANPPANIVDFRGLDSSIILI